MNVAIKLWEQISLRWVDAYRNKKPRFFHFSFFALLWGHKVMQTKFESKCDLMHMLHDMKLEEPYDSNTHVTHCAAKCWKGLSNTSHLLRDEPRPIHPTFLFALLSFLDAISASVGPSIRREHWSWSTRVLEVPNPPLILGIQKARKLAYFIIYLLLL